MSTLEAALLVITGILASGNHVAIFVENARLTQSLRMNLRTLAESERRFRLVLDELAEGVVVAGADGTIRSISARITDLLGWRPAQLVGRSVFEFVHPEDLPGVRTAFGGGAGRHRQPDHGGSSRPTARTRRSKPMREASSRRRP